MVGYMYDGSKKTRYKNVIPNVTKMSTTATVMSQNPHKNKKNQTHMNIFRNYTHCLSQEQKN